MIDPFAPTYQDFEHEPQQTKPRAITLFELNSRVRATLRQTMADCYWVVPEISELRVASNGHCYMEFVQKDEASGSLVAKARANIWRQNYVMITSHFERATGQRLDAGIKVMACVVPEFHELYGFSLNVIDVDPTYTMGDLAARRKEIIRQLEADGVMNLNKELPLPRVISRVAVVSSATAAGYGDFCNQLQQSGYDFTVELFPAIMQGDRVEKSVIAALDRIAAQAGEWDVVVIIRGGGATTDLNGFDTYMLAANVAQFPLPVLTGIGHERDDTIIDLVAHTRLKTPTAVAAFLIERRGNELAMLKALQDRLLQAVQQRLQRDEQRLSLLAQRANYAAMQQVARRRQRFDSVSHRFELASSRYVSRQRECVLKLGAKLELLIQSRLQQQQGALDRYPQRLRNAVDRVLLQAHHRHDMLQRSIKLAAPDRILAMGFSITTHNGKTVRDAATLKPGDELLIRFQTGQTKSVVE